LTEEEARTWLGSTLNVSRETLDKLDAFATLVSTAQQSQNLVSASTLASFWTRHIVDSAQLSLFASEGVWLDIGSGAGLPGIVTAILTGCPTLLVEPRARRAAFLQDAVDRLALINVKVHACKLQNLTPQPVDIITARALTALPALIEMAIPFARKGTIWLLPKGKSAHVELASLPSTWQGNWEVRSSVTDPDSQILIGRHVRVDKKR